MKQPTTQKKTVNKSVSHSEQLPEPPDIHKVSPALHKFCTDLSPAAALTSFLWAWWRAGYRCPGITERDDMFRLVRRGNGPVSIMVELAFSAGIQHKEWPYVINECTLFASKLQIV